MSSEQLAPDDEMTLAETLPQADASALVDRDVLEAQVKDMYRHVAREEEAQLHFAVGRELALRLGYPGDLLDAIPAEETRHPGPVVPVTTLTAYVRVYGVRLALLADLPDA